MPQTLSSCKLIPAESETFAYNSITCITFPYGSSPPIADNVPLDIVVYVPSCCVERDPSRCCETCHQQLQGHIQALEFLQHFRFLVTKNKLAQDKLYAVVMLGWQERPWQLCGKRNEFVGYGFRIAGTLIVPLLDYVEEESEKVLGMLITWERVTFDTPYKWQIRYKLHNAFDAISNNHTHILIVCNLRNVSQMYVKVLSLCEWGCCR